MDNQTEVFGRGEGDAWFRRNAEHLDLSADKDPVLTAVGGLSDVVSLCEVGCANGWRLAALAGCNPRLVDLAGFDISADAIANGRDRWPSLDLHVAQADRPPLLNRQFDAVIVSFVMHWIDRSLLASSIAAIDSLVRDGGTLILSDFFPDKPCKRAYHHRTDVPMFTFKQQYAHCFEGLGTYRKIGQEFFRHDTSEFAARNTIPEQQRAAVVILRKSLTGGYDC